MYMTYIRLDTVIPHVFTFYYNASSIVLYYNYISSLPVQMYQLTHLIEYHVLIDTIHTHINVSKEFYNTSSLFVYKLNSYFDSNRPDQDQQPGVRGEV